jgi:hypothetical protein
MGADGSHVFSGNAGQIFVVAPDGALFRGSFMTPGQFRFERGGGLQPNYEALTSVGGAP